MSSHPPPRFPAAALTPESSSGLVTAVEVWETMLGERFTEPEENPQAQRIICPAAQSVSSRSCSAHVDDYISESVCVCVSEELAMSLHGLYTGV